MTRWTIYYPRLGAPVVREVRWEGQGYAVLCQPDYLNRPPVLADQAETHGRFDDYGQALDALTAAWSPNIRVAVLERQLAEARQQERALVLRCLELKA